MFQKMSTRIPWRRMMVAATSRALVAALFLTAGVTTAAAAETTATFTVAQTLDSTIKLGATSQVFAAVGAVDASGPVTGTVSFYACGPDETISGRCYAGTFFGQGTLDAKAQTLSPSFKPTSGGIWCFRAAYEGSAAYAPSEATGACLQVEKSASSTKVEGPSAWTEGTGATATATVLVPAGGPVATGTVAFSVCATDSLTASSCASPWEAIGTTALDAAGQARSPEYLAPSLGFWCWEAAYGGDRSYHASKAIGACFEVTAAPEPPAEDDATTPDNSTTADNTTAPAPQRLGPGGWKNAAEWPVETLTLGGTEHTAEQARALLAGPTKGDAGKILVRHLITAKLNMAAGALDPGAGTTIAEADALLSTLGGPDAGKKAAKGAGGEVGRMIAMLEGHAAGAP